MPLMDARSARDLRTGGSLDAALTYSDIVFAGAWLVWFQNALTSVLRGTGDMMVRSVAISVGFALLVPLSPMFIFGFGSVPAMGIAGGATAVLIALMVSTAIMAWYLWTGRASPVDPPAQGVVRRLS